MVHTGVAANKRQLLYAFMYPRVCLHGETNNQNTEQTSSMEGGSKAYSLAETTRFFLVSSFYRMQVDRVVYGSPFQLDVRRRSHEF